MKKPLEKIKVVELSTYVAAPATARMLADMGADVIKVETLTGDQWRAQGKMLLKANGFVETIVNRNGYESTVAAPPIRLGSYQKESSQPAPLLGGSTEEIMKAYGYTEVQIQKFREIGAVK